MVEVEAEGGAIM